MTSPHRPSATLRSSPLVRWRAVFAGLFLVAGIGAFDPVARYLISSSPLTRSHMPFAVLLGVLALAYVYNPIVRWLRPAMAFTTRDLAAVLAVGFVGGMIASYAEWLVGALSRPYYFASEENEWPTYVIPYLRPWLFPSNAGDRIAWFYDGLPAGESVPWSAWVVPLFWWITILGALMLLCVSLSVILRKQWSERERLVFPLVELPRLLLQDPPEGRSLPAFFHDRLFWGGFGLSAFMLSWNTVGFFSPGFPTFAFINNNNLLYVARGFMQFYLRFDFYVICFAYFTPLNILFSVWFFHVLGMVQDGVSKRVGFGPEGYGAGVITQNNFGLLLFVLWGLWMARGQFADVWRKAVGRGHDIDDSNELLSYRVAAFGLIGSLLFILFWLRTTGLSWPIVTTLAAFTIVLYLGMAKIVAQSGLVAIRGSGETVSVKELIGTVNMSDLDIATLNQAGALYGGAKGFVLPGAANAARASEFTESNRRRLGATILIGGMLAIVLFIVSSLLLGYRGPGAANFLDAYTWTGEAYHYTVTEIKNRSDGDWKWWWLLTFGSIGSVGTALLIYLTQRFPWWPLHPIGFTISLQYPTRAAFFSIFLAWLFKTIVLRVGGHPLFLRSQTFVVGVLLGYVFSVTVGFVVDVLFFQGQGHALHTPPL